MNLFNELDRVDRSPATHGEDAFSFLNRVAGPGARRVREKLQEWFNRYPAEEQGALHSRFRTEFNPAFHELLLHEMLLIQGARVEVHPILSAEEKTRPDFRVWFDGEALILEATAVRNTPEDEENQKAVLGNLWDQLNQLESPNFFLNLVEVFNPRRTQPSWRRLKAYLVRELAELNPDDLSRSLSESGFDALPMLDYRDPESDPNGFRLLIRPIPKSKKSRGVPGLRTIGVYQAETRWGGSAEAVRRAIRNKLRRYSVGNLPYVIAINLEWPDNDRIDIMQALFGTEQIVFGVGSKEPEGMVRASDGIWLGAQGWRYKELSAVLVTSVNPYNIPGADIRLYHNPAAVVKCPEPICGLPGAFPKEGKMRFADGESLGGILGIELDWPGPLFRD